MTTVAAEVGALDSYALRAVLGSPAIQTLGYETTDRLRERAVQ